MNTGSPVSTCYTLLVASAFTCIFPSHDLILAMSLLRPFQATDLLKFNAINLDAFTETYTISYYLGNLCTWPDQFCCVEDVNKKLMGYSGLAYPLR